MDHIEKGVFSMFNNPGGKIKGLAIFIFIINLIIFIVGGIGLIVYGVQEETILIAAGVATILVGILIAWLSVLFIYAYGSLIEDVEEIRNYFINRG